MTTNIEFTPVGKSYWNSEGNHEKVFQFLTDKFMKPEGKSDTLIGEVVRAANRLYYEYCNNGNCNALESHLIESECWDDEDAEEEYDYTLNPFYENFMRLIRDFFDTYQYSEGNEIISRIENIIYEAADSRHSDYFSDTNMNAYDKMLDAVAVLAYGNMENDKEIPEWYMNEQKA